MYLFTLKAMLKKKAFVIKVISVMLICLSVFRFAGRHVVLSNHRPCNIKGLNSNISEELFQVIAKLDNGNSSEAKYQEKYRKNIRGHIVSNYSVVSYSLFGSESRYTDGAWANTELIKTIYPGWELWLFHDNTVPIFVISSVCVKDHVVCLNMTGSIISNRMSWRFLVASVPFVSRYVIRDIDSRLSVREKAAVDEWITSGKRFHVMRDHPSHSRRSMSGGMWGGTREAVPNMAIMLKCLIDDSYLEDMNFLNDIVWPIAQSSMYQHDSFTCDQYGGGHPFPTKRVGLEHVGSVYINWEIRNIDTYILKNAIPPVQCIPSWLSNGRTV